MARIRISVTCTRPSPISDGRAIYTDFVDTELMSTTRPDIALRIWTWRRHRA
jgi:hypothetical protein